MKTILKISNAEMSKIIEVILSLKKDYPDDKNGWEIHSDEKEIAIFSSGMGRNIKKDPISISKIDFDKLMKEEQEWLGTSDDGWRTIVDFWIDGFTHIVISRMPDGKYQIMRGWIGLSGIPAVSLDKQSSTIEEVITFLISKLKPIPPLIKE